MNRTNIAAIALLALGMLQMAGYVTGFQFLRAVGAATVASPLPIVFSDVKGVETFASRFSMHIQTQSGQIFDFVISPEVYSHLQGAYNRRNVYGAALSYGPRLPEKIWKKVFDYGLCADGPLAKAFKITEPVKEASLNIQTQTRGRNDVWDLPIRCGA